MAQLGININPYVQGLQRARMEAVRAGDKIGKDLKNKLWTAFGGGALFMGVRNLFGDTREIERLSFQWQRSTKDIQAMQYAAERTGLGFGEVMDIVDGTAEDALPHMRDRVTELIEEFDRLGIAIEDNAIKKMNKAAENTETNFGRMKSALGNALGNSFNFIEKNAMLLGAYSTTDGSMSLREFMDSGEAERLLKGFYGPETPLGPPVTRTKKEKVEREKAARRARIDLGTEIDMAGADSLASIGGFIGGASQRTPLVDLAREHLKKLQEIERNTDPDKNETAKF